MVRSSQRWRTQSERGSRKFSNGTPFRGGVGCRRRHEQDRGRTSRHFSTAFILDPKGGEKGTVGAEAPDYSSRAEKQSGEKSANKFSVRGAGKGE